MPTRASNKPPLRFALLRGINVGGKALVSMDDLRRIFTELGMAEVQTYLNSGNVIFRGPNTAAKLAETVTRLEQALETRLKRSIRVLVRTHSEMRKVAAADRFPGADPSLVQVIFCDSKPKGSLDPARSPSDSFIIAGREVYLSCPNGLSQTRFTLDHVERTLGVFGTGRNWNTVTSLAGWS